MRLFCQMARPSLPRSRSLGALAMAARRLLNLLLLVAVAPARHSPALASRDGHSINSAAASVSSRCRSAAVNGA